MNPLFEYFRDNKGRLINKCLHYFDIYHRHFSVFRGQEVTLVEFGVFHGGSLQMWKDYFGPKARIIGVDINPRCKSLEEDQIEIHIGDQEDRNFLRKFRDEIGPVQILIDDGGHTMGQQICTFEEMFPAVGIPGIYLAEDLHTSYWEAYGGGVRRPGSFIEYSKDLIDQLNAWHSRNPEELRVSDFTRSVLAMHYYDSILVIEKTAVAQPREGRTGTPSFTSE